MSLLGWVASRRAAGWLRQCTSVGPEPELRGRPEVRNAGKMRIGARFRLSSQPVASHVVTGPEGDLVIGDSVVIGHGAAIACLLKMRIGEGTHIGPFVSLSDSDFHVVGDRNAVPDPRPVEIGSRVQIGARVTILPGSRIGDGAVVMAGSTVAGVIAAGAVVAGVPARVGAVNAAAGTGAAAGSWADAVRELVQRTLGLAVLPELEQGPAELPDWDSLGALRLLLALEEELGVRLSEKEMVGARRVADLVAFVAQRSTATAPAAASSASMQVAAGVRTAGAQGDLAAIAELVQRVLGLLELPAAESGPGTLAEWDSLGSLKLLLAVEDELGVSLGEKVMAEVRSVAQLAAAVDAARR